MDGLFLPDVGGGIRDAVDDSGNLVIAETSLNKITVGLVLPSSAFS